MSSAASRASAAVTPTGFSQRIGIRADTSRFTVARWKSLGTHTRTASSPPASSIDSRSGWTAAFRRGSASRAARIGSAIAMTLTVSEPARARRWFLPIRPAPASPSLKGATASEAPGGQVLAIGALVGSWLPVAVGQHVLLHHEPTGVAVSHRLQHAVDVEVAFAQTAKGFPAPDLRDGSCIAHDLLDHRAAGVLQVHVVDTAAPIPHRLHRIATSQQEVAGVQTETDGGQLQDLLDLPWRFDVRACFVVERRLVAPCAAARHRHLDAVCEMLPCGGVETERSVGRGLAGPRSSKVAAGVGQRGSRLRRLRV